LVIEGGNIWAFWGRFFFERGGVPQKKGGVSRGHRFLRGFGGSKTPLGGLKNIGLGANAWVFFWGENSSEDGCTKKGGFWLEEVDWG